MVLCATGALSTDDEGDDDDNDEDDKNITWFMLDRCRKKKNHTYILYDRDSKIRHVLYNSPKNINQNRQELVHSVQ